VSSGWGEPIDDTEPVSTLVAWLLCAALVACVLVAVVLEGREATERCRAGIDEVASCQGIVRWSR
jgi:hypothetical protein